MNFRLYRWTFWDGGTRLGDGTLNSAGRATFTTDDLSLGTHVITATYNGNSNFLGGASAALTHAVLSAQQELGLMASQVQALVMAGILSSGNGNALTVKLNNAIASLNSGNTISGVNQMDAFINQVQAAAG